MRPENELTSLKQKRSHTDTSLTSERGKTDESLFEHRKTTEQKTDAKLKSERSNADLARKESRSNDDAAATADSETQESRSLMDDTIKNERTSMDAAIKVERAQKEAVLHQFLEKERCETDDNLLQERSSTDRAVSNSSKLLKDEVNKHGLTQAELTTRDELMALVSHDLRGPIGAVFSCAEMLLQDEMHSSLNNETKYWIEFIKRNAATSLRLISDILDMERIAEGKLKLDPKREDLSEILRHASEQYVHTASAKGVLMRVMPTSSPVFVECDRERILQVLSNLIANAIKFTAEGGKVVLKIEEYMDQLKVSVCDTGKGIAESDQAKIFERFAQLDKKDSRGIGLGLHICKSLIESHKGKIWVESTPTKGSTFYFTLPKSKLQSAT